MRLAFLLLFFWSTQALAADPNIVSKYESFRGCCGPFPAWLTPHSGVDFSGKFGEDVIAPADGEAQEHIGANYANCGLTIVLYHRAFNRYTVYCHFKDVKVRPGDTVKRGDVIGTLGDTGVASDCRRGTGACPIVHMELNTVGHGHPRAKKGVTFDVLEYTVGCFEPGKAYPADRLALTFPVRCKN